MILESVIIIGFAILLDLILGDPKNRYHPTAWIRNLIGIRSFKYLIDFNINS